MSSVISYPDQTLTASFSGGSWLAAMPLTNLANPLLSLKARSTDDAEASTVIKISNIHDTNGNMVRCIGVLNHNISAVGRIRARGYSDSGFMTLVTGADTGEQPAWGNYNANTALLISIGSLPQDLYYDLNGDGTVNVVDVGLITKLATNYKTKCTPNWIYCLPEAVDAQYWKIEIFDTSNPDTYVEVGRIWIGNDYFESTLAYNTGIQYVSNDITEQSLGAVLWGEKRRATRATSAVFENISDDTKFDVLMMQNELGTIGEVLWIEDTDANNTKMNFTAYPATFEQSSEITSISLNSNDWSTRLLEKI